MHVCVCLCVYVYIYFERPGDHFCASQLARHKESANLRTEFLPLQKQMAFPHHISLLTWTHRPSQPPTPTIDAFEE